MISSCQGFFWNQRYLRSSFARLTYEKSSAQHWKRKFRPTRFSTNVSVRTSQAVLKFAEIYFTTAGQRVFKFRITPALLARA